MAAIQTRVTFRVQAVGGKFLADDIGAAITAWQKGTGNTGSAVVNFFCIY